jgi:hypothetical protein
VEALLPSVYEQVCRQAALVSGFVIAVLANVLHHHLAACATATRSSNHKQTGSTGARTKKRNRRG